MAEGGIDFTAPERIGIDSECNDIIEEMADKVPDIPLKYNQEYIPEGSSADNLHRLQIEAHSAETIYKLYKNLEILSKLSMDKTLPGYDPKKELCMRFICPSYDEFGITKNGD